MPDDAVFVDDVFVYGVVHLLPVDDWVAHEPSAGCVCRPTFHEEQMLGSQTVVPIAIHRRLDGKDLSRSERENLQARE